MTGILNATPSGPAFHNGETYDFRSRSVTTLDADLAPSRERSVTRDGAGACNQSWGRYRRTRRNKGVRSASESSRCATALANHY